MVLLLGISHYSLVLVLPWIQAPPLCHLNQLSHTKVHSSPLTFLMTTAHCYLLAPKHKFLHVPDLGTNSTLHLITQQPLSYTTQWLFPLLDFFVILQHYYC